MDAVYAIAHAIDNMIREKCKDVQFNDCEEIQPSPMGYELLKHIHNVSFVGRQNTSVSNLSQVSKLIEWWKIIFCRDKVKSLNIKCYMTKV